MKNLTILILFGIFLISCQEIEKSKVVDLSKIETQKKIIDPKYEIYNAVIKKMRWDRDTILVYTYYSDNQVKKNYDYSNYDTVKLLEKTVLGKDTYQDFIKKIELVEEVDIKFIKGASIFINTNAFKNKRHKKTILKFSPIGFNKDTTKAFLVYEKTEDGGGSRNCLLFEKADNEWDLVYHKYLASIIGCW